nr:MAG TPA: hypothetical protein [Caudoviricetes sp.]
MPYLYLFFCKDTYYFNVNIYVYTFNFTQRKIYDFINFVYSKKYIPLHCQNETRILIIK